jgi:chromatin segregation and condensation protein Rec8/ScpA/Scc1 (kleisin family)
VKYFFVLRYLYKHGDTDFDTLLMTCKTRSDLIAMFMALLQLIRNQLVSVVDENEGNPIMKVNRKERRQ